MLIQNNQELPLPDEAEEVEDTEGFTPEQAAALVEMKDTVFGFLDEIYDTSETDDPEELAKLKKNKGIAKIYLKDVMGTLEAGDIYATDLGEDENGRSISEQVMEDYEALYEAETQKDNTQRDKQPLFRLEHYAKMYGDDAVEKTSKKLIRLKRELRFKIREAYGIDKDEKIGDAEDLL